MLQSFETAAKGERGLRIGLRYEQVLFIGMIGLIFAVRVANLGYSTLFVDEAIYVEVGKSALRGAFGQGALGWMYGSYLYPLLAALLNYGAGEAGLRLLSAVCSTAAAVAIYRAGVRLFDSDSAFWAILIFGMTAISIDIGQLAVYDAPLVLLLAGALFFVVRAADSPEHEHRFLLAGAACAALGVLTKYIGALYMPALICVVAICYMRQRRPLWPILSSFIVPAAAIVGVYAWVNHADLATLLSDQAGVSPGARAQIWADIWAEIGASSLIALAGLGLLLRRGVAAARHEPPPRLIVWAALVLGLAAGLFAAPIYHLASGNLHSAWKHSVYSLIFIAPLAGYACARTVDAVRGIEGRAGLAARLIGLAVSVAIIFGGISYSLGRNNGFQRSWPDASGAVSYLRHADIRPGQPILAAGSQIYQYYLDPRDGAGADWSNTWYLRYDGQEGLPAMRAAVADRHFAWVILDSYYTPEIDRALEPALLAAGYRLTYSDPQTTSTGVMADIRIYQAP